VVDHKISARTRQEDLSIVPEIAYSLRTSNLAAEVVGVVALLGFPGVQSDPWAEPSVGLRLALDLESTRDRLRCPGKGRHKGAPDSWFCRAHAAVAGD
jgi:hypothetical protein